MAIATLSIDIEARLAKLEQGLDQAVRANDRAAQRVASSWSLAGEAAKAALVGAAGALSIGAVAAFGKQMLESVDHLNDVADATGATVEKISALQDVARRTGTAVEVVDTALIKLNQALSGKDDPESTAARALQAIGLQAEELRKLDPADALKQVAMALDGYADDANKARLVQLLFGKSLREVAPLLHDLTEEHGNLAVVTTEQAKQVEKLNKAMAEFEANSLATKRAIMFELVPAINHFMERFNAMQKGGGFFNLVYSEGEAAQLSKRLNDTVQEIERLQSLVNRKMGGANMVEDIKRLQGEAFALSSQISAATVKIKNFGDAWLGVKALPLTPQQIERHVKPSAPKVGGKSGSAESDTEKAIKQYDQIVQRIRERVSMSELEAGANERLNEGQKFALDIVSKLTGVESKLSEEQRRNVAVMLESAVASIQLSEQQKERTKLLADESKRLQEIGNSRTGELNSLRDQLETMGLTADQLEQLQQARLASAIAADQERIATVLLFDAQAAGVDQMRLNVELLEEQLEVRRKLQAKLKEQAESAGAGVERAVADYMELTRKLGDETYRAVGNSLRGLEDVLVSFTTTGKGDFKGLVDSMLAEFMRLSVIRPFMNDLLASFTDAGGLAGIFGKVFSVLGQKDGGAWVNGVQAYAAGGVFGRATLFAHSAGLGVLGEAGPEAVMPLSRGADGKLGVRAQGAGAPALVQHFSFSTGVSERDMMMAMRVARDQAVAITKGQIRQSMTRGGVFAQ